MTFFSTDKETDPYTLTGGPGGGLSTVYIDKDGNKVSFVKGISGKLWCKLMCLTTTLPFYSPLMYVNAYFDN